MCVAQHAPSLVMLDVPVTATCARSVLMFGGVALPEALLVHRRTKYRNVVGSAEIQSSGGRSGEVDIFRFI